MDSYDALRLCDRYAKLGWSIQDQMQKAFEDSSDDTLRDLNMNALARIHEFLVDAPSLVEDDENETDEFKEMAEILRAFAKESGGKFEYGRWVPSPDARVGELGI